MPIPPGEVATTADEAEAIAKKYRQPVVVKAQVHAGGRGKAGGVKLAKTPAEAREKATAILGMQIKGLHGARRCSSRAAADIASEAYVGIIVDRATEEAGVHGEPGRRHRHRGSRREDAGEDPQAADRHALRPAAVPGDAARLLPVSTTSKKVRAAAKIMQQLYTAFMQSGCSLAEINPLVVTPAGDVVALDAKMVIDDNELDRRPRSRRCATKAPKRRARWRRATRTSRSSSSTATSAACVNGAGLAMATMDLVKYYGGEPANFLDIGGSSNPEKVVNALKIITADPNVKAILFNIFGGITRTDDVANGIVTATKQNPLKVPIVIRLTGTNEEIAMKILQENGFSRVVRHGRSGEEGRRARDGRKGRVSIFIDKNTTLVVQGITGRDGSFHTKQMIEYGTKVVGRRDAGQGRPEVRGQGADLQHRRRRRAARPARTRRSSTCRRCSPPTRSWKRPTPASSSSSRITEGVPVLDMTRVYPFVKEQGARLLGPNCPGLISPGKSKVGIIPGTHLHAGPRRRREPLGHAHVRSRLPAHARRPRPDRPASASAATRSTAPTSSTASRRSRRIPQTKVVAMMGEIGGTDEQEAAEFVKKHMKKPVVGFIAGQTAPPGRRMGHAGAIISGSSGTAAEKIEAFEAAGIGVAKRPIEFVDLVKQRL